MSSTGLVTAINSKRVDLLIISGSGMPVAAIEYQGSGHYQGSAAARDAVKQEALRKAGVRYIEVTPEHSSDELVREILRIAKIEQTDCSDVSPPKTKSIYFLEDFGFVFSFRVFEFRASLLVVVRLKLALGL